MKLLKLIIKILMKNKFLKIYGRVQGVGFRQWTKKQAQKYNLNGWVKNCTDKTVECEVSGLKENIDLFSQACLKGPLLSSVKRISEKNISFKKFKSFIIIGE